LVGPENPYNSNKEGGSMNLIKELITINSETENPAHEAYTKLKTAKSMIGSGVFAMGGLLCLIREYDLWQGYADSWKEFCASEAHSYSFAQTAIRLYHKYVVELALPEDKLMELMSRDYTSLDNAATVITEDNCEDWLCKIKVLGRDDLRKEIRVAKGRDAFNKDSVEIVLLSYFSLMYDERQEFKRRLKEREESN
jgi:hypothetical protein